MSPSLSDDVYVLRISLETVKRDWKLAKAWLLRELSHETCNET